MRVKAFLVDVDDISSVRQNFSASLYLEYRWREPSLAHEGPRNRTILPSESNYPEFKVVNAQRVMDTLEGRIQVGIIDVMGEVACDFDVLLVAVPAQALVAFDVILFS